ncbi:MAG: tetratricopeptide repeat protein [Longimicrobiaceae bacterium]
MTRADPAQIRRWSEEVGRDPASLAFLPLAGAYRGQGRSEQALRLCLRGLERHPEHVGAHYLLGLLYRDRGEQTKAMDEWDIALRLDPDHAGAREELERLQSRQTPPLQEAAAPARHLPTARPTDGVTELAGESGVIGVVLLDASGYVVSGQVPVAGRDRSAEVAAALRGASEDASRATGHLELGRWEGILFETERASVRLMPVAEAVVAVAAGKEVPLGWILRLAERARRAAEALLVREEGR